MKKSKKDSSGTAVYCNHCGGAIKPNGEIQTCIMCAREVGHLCAHCSNAHSHEIGDADKKSA